LNDRQERIGQTVEVLEEAEKQITKAMEEFRVDKHVGDVKQLRAKLAAFFELQARALRG